MFLIRIQHKHIRQLAWRPVKRAKKQKKGDVVEGGKDVVEGGKDVVEGGRVRKRDGEKKET
jgi:hypothetical protein